MTFTKVSATGKYAVRPGGKALYDKNRVDPARAHYSDSPQVGRILESADTCRVSCRIAAPVTKKA